MKKVIFLFAISLLTVFGLKAQNLHQENIIIGKETVPGFSLVFTDITPEDINGAIRARLETYGLKKGKTSGFDSYTNQSFPHFGPGQFDIFSNAVRSGGKKSNTTILHFVVTKGNMNPITASADPQIVQNVETFLKEFVDYAKTHATQNRINDLQKLLTQQQKEQKSLQGKRDKIQKQMDDLQKEMDQTKASLDKVNALMQQMKK